MPKKTTKGSLFGKLGNKLSTAFNAHKDDETDYGSSGELPPGIEFGIARLVECKFDQYKNGDLAGEYYFYAAGVVVEPTEHNGIRLSGLRTSIMEPLCDTPGRTKETLEEHLQVILNEMRKLGADTSNIEPEDLEEVAEALKEEGIHFRFRTWQGKATKEYPDPRTNHQWRGAIDDYEPGEDGEDDVVDETVEEEEQEEKPAKVKTTAVKKSPKKTPAKKSPEPEPEPEPEEEEEQEEEQTDETEDVRQLAELADSQDDEAAMKLAEIATDAGIKQSDIDNAESWMEVAELIESVSGEEEETEAASEAESEEEEWVPNKGEVYLYKPKGARKNIECEVSAVFEGKRCCNLKSLDDNKLFRSVPWDDLQGE